MPRRMSVWPVAIHTRTPEAIREHFFLECRESMRALGGLAAVNLTAARVTRQGNRVKESCGDEACEELVVPCGHFAFAAEAVFAGSFSDEVEDDVRDGGEIAVCVIGPDTALVVAEDHAHYPV
jgi:hypothetical protein